MRNGGRSRFILFSAVALSISACMPMGILPVMMGEVMDHPGTVTERPAEDTEATMLQIIDNMVAELVTDLSSQRLDITTVAVWTLSAQPDADHRETVRQKLITQLIASQVFTVVSRERLRELLEEQGLSEVGAIDEVAAVEIGKLTGVDGFIDGYISIGTSVYVLSLSLIDARSGVITWAKTAERMAP